MAYDGSISERMYGTLVSLYPPSFRERVGESMQQTFNDLCRERRAAGESMFSFTVWTFANTLLGVIKETFRTMNLNSKANLIATVIIVGAVIFLGVAWWVNGRDDTWLYVTSGIIALSSFLYIPFSKKGDK